MTSNDTRAVSTSEKDQSIVSGGASSSDVDPQTYVRQLVALLKGKADTIPLSSSQEESKTPDSSSQALAALLKDMKEQHVTVLQRDKEFHDALCSWLTRAQCGGKGDVVCQWLYNLYTSGGDSSRVLVLQFVPVLVWVLIQKLSSQQQETASGVAACVLGIYEHTKPPEHAFRLPDVFQESVFFDALPALDSKRSQEEAEKEHKRADAGNVPVQNHDRRVTASNAMRWTCVALERYRANLSAMPHYVRQRFCWILSSMLFAGCAGSTSDLSSLCDNSAGRPPWIPKKLPRHRFALSGPVLQESLRCISFCLQQPPSMEIAKTALLGVHNRATEELLPEVLLESECIFELHASLFGQQ